MISAREKGYKTFIVPADNEKEAGYVGGVNVYAARTLREVVDHLSGYAPLRP